MKKVKKIRVHDKVKAQKLKEELGLNYDTRIISFLISRGIDTAEKIREFFDYSINDFPDIKTYRDGEKALNRLIQAVEKNDRVLIYGDYDVDGITATSILINTLRDLGVECSYFINDRFDGGFGIYKKGVDEALKKFDCDLIVTVDNGFDRVEVAEYIKSLGKELVITDHHQPREDGMVPDAIAAVDAHRADETGSFKEMCGAGLALMLALPLYASVKKLSNVEVLNTKLFKHNFALAAFGTVADVMILHGYNRYIVKKGLSFINETESIHPSWDALKKVSGKAVIDEVTFGWTFGPMINALSRMTGSVLESTELFIATDLEMAMKCAERLNEINEQRKSLTQEQVMIANGDVIINQRQNALANIVYGNDYHLGIAGLVAGNLCNQTSKLTIVLGEGGENKELYKGSVRSPEWIDAKKLLDGCKDILASYGGHAGAAGVSIRKDRIKDFIRYIDSTLAEMDLPTEEPQWIDFKLTASNVSVDFVKELRTLAPFGMGFNEPVCMVLGCVTKTQKLKETGLKLILDYKLQGINWTIYQDYQQMVADKEFPKLNTGQETVLVYGKLSLNKYGGVVQPQITVDSVEPWYAEKNGVSVKLGFSTVSYCVKK